ncbi:hypothetical protein L6R52_16580 [Myxococcota bacterium]|nr:hypothetical protein [Myxococcota bacterium]
MASLADDYKDETVEKLMSIAVDDGETYREEAIDAAKAELTRRGITPPPRPEKSLDDLRYELRELQSSASGDVLWGGLMVAVGGALAVFAAGGGYLFVWYGGIIVGTAMVFRGLTRRGKIAPMRAQIERRSQESGGS